MKMTNDHNLPDELLQALKPYDRKVRENRYSVTEIIDAPCKVLLTRRHYDEIVEDASSRIWAMFGSAMHSVIEQNGKENWLLEKKLVTLLEGITIAGVLDIYKPDEQEIVDFKTTSVWSIIYGDRLHEWALQLNIYAWMLRRHGYPVKAIANTYILKDHNAGKALQGGDYPQIPAGKVYHKLMTDKQIEEYLLARFAVYEVGNKLYDENLIPCTARERWAKPTTYAVMKGENKRATKVCDDLEFANNYILRLEMEGAKAGTYNVVERLGEDVRCNSYCSVKEYCPYYKNKEVKA